MGEIKRDPYVEHTPLGETLVCFDEDHTLADIVRYLLTQGDVDDILYLIEKERQ